MSLTPLLLSRFLFRAPHLGAPPPSPPMQSRCPPPPSVDYHECFRVYNNPNVTVHFSTEAVDLVSNTKGQMSGILVRKVDTGDESVLDAKGLIYGLGHSPNTQLLEGQVELDHTGTY